MASPPENGGGGGSLTWSSFTPGSSQSLGVPTRPVLPSPGPWNVGMLGAVQHGSHKTLILGVLSAMQCGTARSLSALSCSRSTAGTLRARGVVPERGPPPSAPGVPLPPGRAVVCCGRMEPPPHSAPGCWAGFLHTSARHGASGGTGPRPSHVPGAEHGSGKGGAPWGCPAAGEDGGAVPARGGSLCRGSRTRYGAVPGLSPSLLCVPGMSPASLRVRCGARMLCRCGLLSLHEVVSRVQPSPRLAASLLGGR